MDGNIYRKGICWYGWVNVEEVESVLKNVKAGAFNKTGRQCKIVSN